MFVRRAPLLSNISALVLLFFAACGGGGSVKTCLTDVDCAAGQICVPLVGEASRCFSGSRADGGPRQDGGPSSDGGPVLDGGPTADGGPTIDGGPAADGGGEDGGPGLDGGADDGGASADGGLIVADGGPVDGGVVLPGATCADAARISAGTIIGTTVGYDAAISGDGLSECGRDGPERFYAIDVPAGQRLRASVRPIAGDGGAVYDPALYLIGGPAASCVASPLVCLDSDDSGGASTVNSVSWANGTGALSTIFIGVDSYYGPSDAASRGEFQLDVSVEAPPIGETCASAEALSGTTSRTNETTAVYLSDYDPSGFNCPFGAAGPDRVYSITVPGAQRVRATITPIGGYVPRAYLVAAPAANCDADNFVCLASDSGAGGPRVVTWANPAPATDAVVFLVVDSDGTGGNFDLDVAVESLPAGDTCEVAEALTVSASVLTVNGSTTLHSNNYDVVGGNGCVAQRGRDRVYQVRVPNGERLEATVAPGAGADPSYDPGIYLIAAPAANCTATPLRCLAADDTGFAPAVNRVFFTNRESAPKDVFIVVDSFATGDAGGPYTLTASVAAPPAGPAGERCETPVALAAGTPLADQSFSGFANDYAGGGGPAQCPSANGGPDRVYAVEVPPTQRLVVTVTPSEGLNTQISLVAAPATGCDALPSTCLAGNNSGGAGAPDVASFTNGSASMQTVLVVVDTPDAAPTGTFTISATVQGSLVGETCATATPITTSGAIFGTTVGYSDDYAEGEGCSGISSADHVYAIDVPGGQRFTASVRPTATTPFDPSINIVVGPSAACDVAPITCFAGDDSGGESTVNTARYDNRGTEPQRIFVLVDNYLSAVGTFELTTELVPIPPAPEGDRCDNAIAITEGTRAGETTTGFNDDLAPLAECTDYDTAGPDKVYAIAVPAGRRLRATVRPDGEDGDPAVYLVAGPAASCVVIPTPCLDGDDSGSQSATNEAVYTNTTAGEQTIFVVIDSISEEVPSFTLTTALETP